MEEQSEYSAPRAKRRRVALACDLCRKRKMKCDGMQPACAYCLERGIACVYQHPQQRVQVTQEYLTSLLQRVDELEQSKGTEKPSGTDLAGLRNSSLHHGGETRTVLPSPESLPAGTDSDFPVDAMGCAGPSPPATAGYFGDSSTLAFLNVLQTNTLHMQSQTSSSRSAGVDRLSPRSVAPEPASTFRTQRSRFLPPRATADHLVDVYFARISDLYTVLHEPSFRGEYEKLWQPGSETTGNELWMCILNSVFALASMFSDRLSREDSEEMANDFFLQAKDLCQFDSLDNGGLTVVQALLLMGQYLQGTTNANRCWYIFGLATRISQGLGLHLGEVNKRFPPLERELRKRCWCGCLIMDTVLAMTFGRPMMIPPEHYDNIDMPAEVDDAQITETQLKASQPSVSARILLFNHKLKLYCILNKILGSIYQRNAGAEAHIRCGDMMDLDQQLFRWQDELPPFLRMTEAAQGDDNVDDEDNEMGSTVADRPRNILYARYLTVRILLTRPSLAAMARMTDSSTERLRSLEQAFAYSAAEICIGTAKRLIDHVRARVVTQGSSFGASWYNTHSVFSAGLVLFTAHMNPILRSKVMEDDRHWTDCIDVMRRLSCRFSSAGACLSILELLNRHLSQQQSQGGSRVSSSQLPVYSSEDSNLVFPTDHFSPTLPDSQDWMEFLGLDQSFGKKFRLF